MSNEYYKGSEWRKWDLHVHTASSYDAYHGSDSDNLLSTQLIENHISVVAITDHFVISRERIENLRKLAPSIIFFPGVELRTDKGSCNIHVILIFDLKSNLKILEEDFNVFRRGSAKNEGDNEKIYWDFNDIQNFATEHHALMSLHAGSKDKGVDDRIKNDSKFKQAVKDEYADVIDIFEVGKLEDIVDYKEKVFPDIKIRKPIIICSDNHTPNDYVKDYRDLWLWIKADPTFEGLKQILREPEERVFVGKEPPLFSTILNNKTKYIEKLLIKPVSGYTDINGKWFNNEIFLNKELVSIIGNKGNGKSAVADIIANCCNCHEQEYFSFLNEKKFRDGKLAQNFEATVTFADRTSLSRNLNESDIPENLPLVKYLPQGYFENICNDLQKDDNLKKEIENVVFGYIDESRKLGASSFQELISIKTRITKELIEESKGRLSQINQDIIDLEKKENAKYLSQLESEIKQKEKEISALVSPVEVSCPDSSSEESQKIIADIKELTDQQNDLQKDIAEKTGKKNELAVQNEELQNFIRQITEVSLKVKEFISSKEEYVTSLGISINEIISITTSISPIQSVLDERKKDYAVLVNVLDPEKENDVSLLYRLKKIEENIQKAENLLAGPQKEYQIYLRNKETYETAKAKIEGDTNIPQTLRWYTKEKEYVTTQLPIDLDKKYEERRNILKKIYEGKQEVISIYKTIKTKIDSIIEKNKKLLEGYAINIDASLELRNDFSNTLLSFINKTIKGSFKGAQEGAEILNKIIKDNPIQEEKGAISLCDSIINHLKHDYNKEEDNRRYIDDQVSDMQAFYTYLFSFEYIDYSYQLKLGKKPLSLLSPGEKGALLLVFYLLLDMDNKPLILDQPEDNLDNDSVANVLVNFIKKAKKKRQIIMVTHNPNLAVVADSEQIIYVNIDKRDNCKFSVETGSIENQNINKHIVDVLEGAMPAFRKRDDKYIKP